MKKSIVLIVLAFIAIVAASNNAEAQRSCFGYQPMCLYPTHTACICDNYGNNCHWGCSQ